jgi:hypothetical protein
LLGISLDAEPADTGMLAERLAAARRDIAHAQWQGLGTEKRFDAACKAIMHLAMAALSANGCRTMTSKPGHHQTAMQALPSERWVPAGQGRCARCAVEAAQPVRLSRRLDPGGRRRPVPGQRAGPARPCASLAQGEPARPSVTAARASLYRVIDAFRLPAQALVAQRIQTTLLAEQGAPTAADKRLIDRRFRGRAVPTGHAEARPGRRACVSRAGVDSRGPGQRRQPTRH